MQFNCDPAQPSTPAPRPARGGWLIRLGVQSAACLAVGALLLTMLGVAQRTGWITAGSAGMSSGSGASGKTDGRYICPMMCTPPSTEPGRCPVCAMELVEASSGGGGDGVSVTIDPSARRMIGIRTAMSKLGPVHRTIRTIGSIDYDQSRISTISAYVDGRLEKMFADYIGFRVQRGDDLALIYSPQLYSAQTEYIAGLSGGSLARLAGDDSGDLLQLARENLSELGMTDQQIDLLSQTRKAQSRIRIASPQSGTVIDKAAVEGDYVETGQKLFRIADLSSVWLMLDLFPEEAAAVRFGQQVEAEIQSMPGEVFTGRVAFIDPTVSAETRSVRVRVEILNFDGKLRPGDYATARITVPAVPRDMVYDPALAGKYIGPTHPQVIRDQAGKCPLCGKELIPTAELGYATEPLPEDQVVTVPRNAVLMAGSNSVLYVESQPGRFEIRRVAVGALTDDHAVILKGLNVGETVATDGNFLIDSQMQLAGNPSLLDPSRAATYAPGPLDLDHAVPVLLAQQPGAEFDRAYAAYFEIQAALASDTTVPPTSMNTLIDSLAQLKAIPEVPDPAQRHLDRAWQQAQRLDGSLETVRMAFREISHAMLRAASHARGPLTAQQLTHFHCPMVPGGGGDWMQPGGQVTNPYWGAEMLRCGEAVRDMAVDTSAVSAHTAAAVFNSGPAASTSGVR